MGCSLRCACTEDLTACKTIHNMQVDFKTAQQFCMESGGKLLKHSSTIIESLLFNKSGHYWIGVEDDCLSSRKSSRGDSVTLNRGEEDVECSSRCMSVSGHRTLTEHKCEEQVDGFLCDGIQWETCWEFKTTEVQILDAVDCMLSPCEYVCDEVPGGHMCTCSTDYRLSRKDPHHCDYYCDSETCPLRCPECTCPEGFVKDETDCIDINECTSNHNCAQKCMNTIGGYMCSCREGFVLVNTSECVPLVNPTPLSAALVTPSVNYTLGRAAFATSAEYLGLTLFLVLILFGLIGFLYYLQKKKSDVLLKDTDSPDQITVHETQLHF
ncbi:thrombomodulin-like [Silurus meridionalis]|nr:thrombomodulin-like [Silurus meridionalis]